MDELSQIKQKIDIVSFIQEFLSIKKAGRNFKVNCPFHNEKTPSFVVSPERQIFHCFGCNVGGDIFSFLMKYENIEFPEALRTLAARAGIELKDRVYDNELSKTKEKLYELNHLASEFYHYLLTQHTSAVKARDYLKKRAINEGSIKLFKIGFVPNLQDSLIKFLVGKKNYKIQDLEKAGLALNVKGNYIDKFKNRITFPLLDHRGNIVGFSGRILEEAPQRPSSAGQAKYINTQETLIYHKGDLLYGLYQAKDEIKKVDSAIFVEGEFDVIQSRQYGIKNVVAIKGTALTESQAKLVSRWTSNINLCLDQDRAGEIANKRGIEILENVNSTVRIIKLANGKDPDSSLRENPVLFKKAVKTPLPIYDFIIDSALSRSKSDEVLGKKKISEEVVPFLAKITNEIVKNHYVKKLAKILEVSEVAVMGEIAKVGKKESEVQTVFAKKDKRDREEILAEYLLALIIQSEEPQKFQDKLTLDIFTLSLYQKIFKFLYEFISNHKFSIRNFINFVPPELTPAIDKSFLFTLPELIEEQYFFEVEKTINELKRVCLRKKMLLLAQKIKIAELEKNDKELALLKSKFEELINELGSANSATASPMVK